MVKVFIDSQKLMCLVFELLQMLCTLMRYIYCFILHFLFYFILFSIYCLIMERGQLMLVEDSAEGVYCRKHMAKSGKKKKINVTGSGSNFEIGASSLLDEFANEQEVSLGVLLMSWWVR